jgi:hypothetical protein
MAVKGRGGCSERPSPPRSVPATVTGSVQSIPGRWMNRRQALTGTDAQGRTCTPRMGRPMTEQRPIAFMRIIMAPAASACGAAPVRELH